VPRPNSPTFVNSSCRLPAEKQAPRGWQSPGLGVKLSAIMRCIGCAGEKRDDSAFKLSRENLIKSELQLLIALCVTTTPINSAHRMFAAMGVR
jgi:hypothetical protein